MIRIMGKKEKASVGKEASLEIKNQTIIIKEFTKNCYISPIPFAGSQQEHLALYVPVRKGRSEHPNAKNRQKRKSLTPPLHHRTITPEFRFKKESSLSSTFSILLNPKGKSGKKKLTVNI